MGAASHPHAGMTPAASGPVPLQHLFGKASLRHGRGRIPIATKLILSFLLIIAITILVFSVVGAQLVGRLIVSEAQAAVRNDLNSAREILLSRQNHINDVVRLTADRYFLKSALLSGKIEQFADELVRTKEKERLDILTVTDRHGLVLLRASNLGVSRDDRNHDPLIAAARNKKEAVASVSIMTADELRKESPLLADQAFLRFVPTPKARARGGAEETAGMILRAAAPILDARNETIGFVYGGVLLNRNYEIVDKIKHTVFQDVQYRGREIGTATIFQDDVRISTNVMNLDGSRAIGTRIAEDVYHQVVLEGKPWIGRAYVVNDWYITAYEPIKDISDTIIGILYVGVLEQKYADIKRRTVAGFLGLTLTGALISMALAYTISRRISGTVARLASASREMAHGNLDVRVDIKTKDELEDLAEAFNAMASSLKRRDEQLKEYTRSKIMESERLAITGQLAAGVAHELNNPLQGIVTYSHLLLERLPADSPMRISLQKIANQADRCREIIRGLLDFARPRPPQMKRSNVSTLLQECVSLVENQALFHNIQIVREFQKDLPPIVIDPSQMQQVFMNMVINAAEAMDGVGRLTIATRLDPSQDSVEVEFTDTGHGIRPEDMGRIFNPFFTTKDPGHGTGLGLAISHSIVQKHKGTIAVASEVQKGTTFTIRIPITNQEAA